MVKTAEILGDVVSRCAGVRSLSSARAITRHYDTALRPIELTITQFTLLVAIGAIQPKSISEIGDWLSIERTSVTRNLKPLEARGLIQRGEEGTQRMRPVSLTKSGQAKLKESYPLWAKAQAEIEDIFTKTGFADAMEALSKLRSVDGTYVKMVNRASG